MSTLLLAFLLAATADCNGATLNVPTHPQYQKEAGWYQVERSNTAEGWEIIYYLPGQTPNLNLHYPGAPWPSHKFPKWPRQPTQKYIAMVARNGNAQYVGPFSSEATVGRFCQQWLVQNIPCKAYTLTPKRSLQ